MNKLNDYEVEFYVNPIGLLIFIGGIAFIFSCIH